MPGQEWSRGFAEDKERRLVRKHLPYSQGLTMIIVISWWLVMIMLMMSLCPNSCWWGCLRSSVLQSKLHFHWQRQTSSQSFACPNDNISPENLLPPPVYTAQVTIITNHLSIFYLFTVSMDFRPRQNIWFLLENRLCWVLLKKTSKTFANCRFPTTVATVLCTLPGEGLKVKINFEFILTQICWNSKRKGKNKFMTIVLISDWLVGKYDIGLRGWYWWQGGWGWSRGWWGQLDRWEESGEWEKISPLRG